MIRFQDSQGVFQFRCVAVILHADRVLLHKAEADDFWTLPGGRVEFFEFVQDTLVRELKEELDCTANVVRPLWFVENFFTYHTQDCHEISYYFLVNITDDVILAQESEFCGIEVDCKLIFKWFDLQDLANLSLYPVFLKSELLNLPSGLTSVHIDERDKI
jgi:8-oxo-dGTP pyrophosphatase MutT (NUDIX family)